jgi:hypothetical protein
MSETFMPAGANGWQYREVPRQCKSPGALAEPPGAAVMDSLAGGR